MCYPWLRVKQLTYCIYVCLSPSICCDLIDSDSKCKELLTAFLRTSSADTAITNDKDTNTFPKLLFELMSSCSYLAPNAFPVTTWPSTVACAGSRVPTVTAPLKGEGGAILAT